MSQLIETVIMVQKMGLKQTAQIQGLTLSGIIDRIKRLEKQTGIQFFAPYDYDRMTWQGREFLKTVD